jgi:hypothetical protein
MVQPGNDDRRQQQDAEDHQHQPQQSLNGKKVHTLALPFQDIPRVLPLSGGSEVGQVA